MLHGDCAQAWCIDLDNNDHFLSIPFGIGAWRWEQGTMTGGGGNVSEILTVPATLYLALTKVNQNLQTDFVGISPSFTTSPLDYAVLNYDDDSCSWIGSMSHPGGSYQPDMFIQLWAYNDSETDGFKFFGKIWGGDWDVDDWLRITGGWNPVSSQGIWQTQQRHLKENGSGACEWLPHGGAEMPTWMQSLPSSYSVSVNNTDDGCECGDVSFSGILPPGGFDARFRDCEEDGIYLVDGYRDEDQEEGSCVRGVYLNWGINRLILSMHFGQIVGGTYGQLGWSDRFHTFDGDTYTEILFPTATRNPFGDSVIYHASTSTYEPDLSPDCITPAPSVTVSAVW